MNKRRSDDWGDNWICDCYLIQSRKDRKCYTCLTTIGTASRKKPVELGLGKVIVELQPQVSSVEEFERESRLKKIKEGYNMMSNKIFNKTNENEQNIQTDSPVQ